MATGARPPTGGAKIVSEKQRDLLIERVKTDPAFREKLKGNWADAFTEAGIDPKAVKGKVLQQRDTQPFTGGPVQAGISIEITISASATEESVKIDESVIFDSSKT